MQSIQTYYHKKIGNAKLKKVLYTDFVGTDTIIAELLEDKTFKKAMTRSNLYKFWAKAAGAKFAAKSKPYSMMGGNVMVIACENSIVAQELMLKKTQILVKLQPYLKSLKLNVRDLKFDAKRWEAEG